MKALVTGATGLLGNNLVRLLLDEGVEVRTMSTTANHARALAALDIERFEADVRDAEAVARATKNVDAVFHCAGCVKIGWSHRAEHESINHGGTRNVADALRGRDVRLVHVSTVNALGAPRAHRWMHEDEYNERITPCPYVTSKRAGQAYVLRQVETGDLNAVVVLPGYLLGPWDWKPSSGQVLLSLAKRSAPMVPLGGISLADVRDVARGTVSAFQRGKTGRSYILAGHNLTFRELLQLMAEATGTSAPFLPLGPVNREIACRSLDLWYRLTGREPLVNSATLRMMALRLWYSSKRAADELDYRFRPAEESVRDAWQWLRMYHGAQLPAPDAGRPSLEEQLDHRWFQTG